MGETTGQIESHIANKRADLHSNLKELESKVKSATDWRQYFQKHTGTMVAAAFGGGIMISALARKRSPTPVTASSASQVPSATQRAERNGTHEILETWDTIKTALVGVAATKFKGMLGEVVPGFSEHLTKTEANKGGPNVRSAESIVEG